ncbi:hypothetical protein JTE90_015408 [Oedothorax gibbosus]|uniref:Ankyrin repeat domain-containing protein 12 n=1 Tax=Oedothorax gibbosus TaxID=931172 RepID=A0AAV6U7E1_9ARAC|nr:hypothetical protein JTE90_015408 [Oedothorax gibbosus]
MRRKSSGEGSSMSDTKTSPALVKRSPLKSRRKLPFSENCTTPSDLEVCSSADEKARESTSDPTSLTPRRHPPLSERQQIALLCRLSGTSSTESSPVTTNEEGRSRRIFKRNERGETPLHIATIKGDYKRVQSLLKKGANVNTPDFAGWTPLHEACNHGWYKIAKLLIEFDAEVNAVGLDKFTPLHDAAVNEHEDIVKLLLKYGANPLQENAHRRTPLDLAKSEKIAELLKASIELPKNSSDEDSPPSDQASDSSPCQPSKAVRELTMRKNSPPNQTQKGACEKPTSPRLTLRFQSIKRDDKSCSGGAPSKKPFDDKYQSYCVTMEAKGYDQDTTPNAVSSSSSTTHEEPVQSSTGVVEGADEHVEKEATSNNTPEEDVSKEISSSPNKDAEEEKMDTSEPVAVPSKINGGGRMSADSPKECPTADPTVEREEGRRKRRRSNDSAHSTRSKGSHKSPSGKSSTQGSPKLKKRGGSQSSSDTESNPSDAEAEPPNAFGAAGAGPHSPKVPPLKIVIPSGSGSLEETRERSKVSSSKQALPYVVNTTSAESAESGGGNDSSTSDKSESVGAVKTPPADGGTPSKSKDDAHPPEEKFQRVTRSSQRMAAMSGGASSSTPETSAKPASNPTETNPSTVTSSGSQKGDGSGDSSNDEQSQSMQIDVHPRKRKLRARESENGSQNQSSSASSSNEDSQTQQQTLNSYQMYLNIRKQVDKRRKSMFIVQPKPPNGFKDYLLNRCSYVLEGNPASRLSVPMITPPQSLDGPIKELFIEQEKERYRLRLQHLIEREKLVLSVEQEILRVHGRSARAMANQTVPLSVCSVLKDEEIYNVLEDDKDKNVRSRYNGRLLLSWLQDVDDKWKKIKEAMLLRHHNEAESLHAVQKLDWEWKMKALGMCDMKTSPVIDDIVVPIVHVNDEFKLVSACQ